MGTSTYTALQGCGQANFDTIVLDTTNNALGFTVASPLNGCMPYAAASIYRATPATPPPNTPARMAMAINSSFTASNMQSRLTGTGGNTIPTVPVNFFFQHGASAGSLAQGAINVAFPYGAGFPAQPTGLVYSDTQNQDWLPAGDVGCFCIGWAAGTGAICASTAQWQADYASGVAVPLSSSVNRNSAAYVPLNIYTVSRKWLSPSGDFFAQTGNPGQVQEVMTCSGTWSKLEVLMDSVQSADAYWRKFQSFYGTQFLSTDPGAAGMPYGAQVININGVAAGTSSLPYTDTQNHDWIPANDFIGVEESAQTNTSYTWYMGMTSLFTPDNPNTSPCLSGGETNTGSTTAKSWVQNSPGGGQARFGSGGSGTSENMGIAPCAGTFSGLNVVCGAVGASPASGAFYVNTANDKGTPYGAQVLSSISAVGKTQDTQNQDWVPAGDAFSNSLTGFDSTFTLNSQSIAFTTVGPAGGGRGGLLLRGVG